VIALLCQHPKVSVKLLLPDSPTFREMVLQLERYASNKEDDVVVLKYLIEISSEQ
jgi:hypothetical protein